MSPLSRRALLGGCAAGATLLSGCASVVGFGNDCTRGYTLELDPLTDAELAETVTDDPRASHAEAGREILRTAASEGEATYTTYHGAPLRTDVFVEHDGVYYRVAREVTGTRELTARAVSIEYDRDETPSGDAGVVAFSDLPEPDREAFLGAFPTERMERADEPRGFSIGGYPHVYGDESASDLIGAGTVWVRYEDRTYAVTVEGTRTVEEETFRYTLTEVAADRAAFVAFVREEYVVELDGLSSAERAVVEGAIDNRVTECEELPEAFAGVVERVETLPVVPGLGERVHVVTYEGETYRLDLSEFVS